MRRELHESHLRLGLELLKKQIAKLWLRIDYGDHSIQMCTQLFYRLTLSLVLYRMIFCLN